MRPIAALRARVWAGQGRLTDALAWVRTRGLAARDELSYVGEYEYVTLARLMMAEYRHEGEEGTLREAVDLLARLHQAAEAGDRMGSAVEILVLQALAHHLQGDAAAALGPLARALTLAEPEGYMRLFVDEGSPMAELLQAAAQAGIAPDYVGRLLAALDVNAGSTENESLLKRREVAAQPAALLEPLSERETEVLRLLATELSGPEIARALYVSLNTLRTHTKNIYGKLGVTSRRAAVRRAEELGLL